MGGLDCFSNAFGHRNKRWLLPTPSAAAASSQVAPRLALDSYILTSLITGKWEIRLQVPVIVSPAVLVGLSTPRYVLF